MNLRIHLSSATVKALQTRLPQAYPKDEVRVVRRPTCGNRNARVHTGRSPSEFERRKSSTFS
jgi:hypothetical protein